MSGPLFKDFVLAFRPTSYGFAFVLFEAPGAPFDWGVSTIHGPEKNARTLVAFKRLVERYHPLSIVVEDVKDRGIRRTPRVRRLHQQLRHVGIAAGADVSAFTREVIRQTFASAGARTKAEIAEVIAATIPAFAHRLPRKRKIWMSEDPRLSLIHI